MAFLMMFIFMLFRKYFFIYETLYYLVDLSMKLLGFHLFIEELSIMSVSFTKKIEASQKYKLKIKFD